MKSQDYLTDVTQYMVKECYEVDDALYFIFDEPDDTVFVYEKVEALLTKHLNRNDIGRAHEFDAELVR